MKTQIPTKDSQALQDVLTERMIQDAKWGVQNHCALVWIAILSEEVGEVAKEIILARDKMRYRDEMVHVAAVALAAVECFDANENPDVDQAQP